jgi:hypothetical protein
MLRVALFYLSLFLSSFPFFKLTFLPFLLLCSILARGAWTHQLYQY